MINLQEIAVANGITILAMWFLLGCRRKNRESLHAEDDIYDGMVLITLLGALFETISFLVDGQDFIFGRSINYLSNSVCFLGTVSVGLLWCLYVNIRISHNDAGIVRSHGMILLPWLVEAAAILWNLFGSGILFNVSENNVYHRNAGASLGYITLMIYFVYSVYLVCRSESRGFNRRFFPVQYFVGPCIAGVIVQFFCYGITTSWISVAMALVFVQMQTYAENLYKDELSGLFNRRYLNGILAKQTNANRGSLHGIMMDINDFKSINDRFGHSVGDQAICCMGEILSKSIPNNGVAIRYAGDEFIVLVKNADTDNSNSVMREIHKNLSRFNALGSALFTLSVSMGYADFEANDDAESFLRKMDAKMYEEKRRYHLMQK